jgi:polyphosphate kinase
MPGISHNIRVRSVVGRFLEHDRVYYFLAGGREVVLCGSADWMARNLIRRIEVAFPILDPALKQRVIDESLHTYLGSDEATWELDADGSYALATVRPEAARVAQATLMERHARPAAG